jgi:hypothetical protein
MVTYSIKKEAIGDKTLTDLVACLLNSATIAHVMHWQTTSYSQHIALGEYYDEIVDLVDAVVEAYQGKTNTILTDFKFMSDPYLDMTPLEYMLYLDAELTAGRALFGAVSEIQNLVDSIADLIDSTIYKIRRFA